MRSSLARRAVVAGSAALLLLLPTSAVANADEDPIQAAVAALPPDLVAAVERDLGISAHEYLAKAELAQTLARYADSLRSRFPDSFGGAWLSDQGIPTIGVTDAATKVAVAADGYQTKDVALSEIALKEDLEGFNAWVGSLPPQISGVIRSAMIDLSNNGVVVSLEDNPLGQALQLPAFLGAVRTVFGPPALAGEPPAPGGSIPGDAILGGDAFIAEGGGSAFECSFGFNGTSGGQTVNISAAHCDPNQAAAGTAGASTVSLVGGPQIGTIIKSRLADRDYSVIKIDDGAAARFDNNGVRGLNGAPLRIAGVAEPVTGAPVCKSGITTGFNCGTVTSVNETVRVGDRILESGFSANICALTGDSGGAVVTGTLALGISSASNVGDSFNCTMATLSTIVVGDSPQVFASPITKILADSPDLAVRTT